MARHIMQIPINKSSNTAFGRVVIYEKIWNVSGSQGGGTIDEERVSADAVSNKLYGVRPAISSDYLTGMGLGWDSSLIPTGKTIVGAKLHFYTTRGHSSAIYHRFVGFNEGSNIPSSSPADGLKSGGASTGWGSIDLGELKGDSVVVYAYLPRTRVESSGDIVEYFGGIWELYSHRNPTNKPYLEVTYDDIPPGNPKSLYPSNITLNPRDIIKFSWLHDTKEDEQQKGFSLQYSTNSGSSWTTVAQTTLNQFYDMPASTLPTSGTVMWKVKTTDTNDTDSGYTTASFTLGVVPQKAPIPISPISQYIDENNPIRFEWAFIGGSDNETQSKFDLQYSANGGSTWTTKTVTSGDNFYILPANTLTGGNITWRVRTYNNWNEVSPYSENRSFTVIGSPPIPQITSVTNRSRPTINWQATGQHIYELQILKDNKVIFETGSIPSINIRSFKVESYLLDGNYLAKLRILNEYNLYSPWAEKSFTISTVKPLKPIVDIYNSEYSITIKTSNTSLKTLVYRDNILIGEGINNSFTDYTGENNKEYKYFVRTLDIDENFTDSDIKLAKCRFSGNTLAVANNPGDFIKLKYGLNSRATKSNQFSVAAIIQNYDGREYPVTEYSEFSNRSKSLTFYLQTRKDLLKFIDMIEQRKTFLFRNRDGDNIYGTILSIDFDENETFWGYETGFSIVKTDYKGVVYD